MEFDPDLNRDDDSPLVDEGFLPEQGELEQRGDDFDDSGFVVMNVARDENLSGGKIRREILSANENMEVEHEDAALGSRSK